MFVIIGFVVVLGSVVGGYMLEHGNMSVLMQPVELLIIFGAAGGAFVIGSPQWVIKATIHAIAQVFSGHTATKEDYLEILSVMYEIFAKIRKEGLVNMEADVDKPAESEILKKYPKFLKSPALDFVIDTMRTMIDAGTQIEGLDQLLDAEMENRHEEALVPSKSVANLADGLPGLGIVAAVLGVVITMGKISEPPEVLGNHIGAALVGTFLGVLCCYGFVGPLARKMEFLANEEKEVLNVLKTIMLTYMTGVSPVVAIEFGRRVIPGEVKPSYKEVEEAMAKLKKK